MKRTILIPAFVLLLTAACARQPRPATVPAPPPPPKPGIGVLRADLAGYFRVPAFSNAIWGISIRSLSTGEVLFAMNPGTFLMPASNMKVVTASVTAERLGWDYRFETKLVSAAAIDNGTLAGDVVIVGAGDPSLGGKPGDAVTVLDAWAAQLRERGITRIAGRIVGDDNAHDDVGLGAGWAWDYLGSAYATPTSALSFGENVVTVILTPGAAAGEPAAISSRPAGHGLTIAGSVTTGAADSRPSLDFNRLPGSSVLTVSGSVPAGRAAVERLVSVDNPTLFTAGVLKAALIERGIQVDGEAVDIDAIEPPAAAAPESVRTLASWTSPPLAEILKHLLKVSQNLYADTMLERVGRVDAATVGSVVTGRKAVQETLASWGIAPDRYIMADGSGLSRYDYLTADVLAAILTRMYGDARHRAPFSDALPIAGVDGTIGNRMKGTPAENNARAKTGSIANARALSGYVTTAEGEPLVFSMIVNNFNVPQSEADAVIDRAVARLAAFRRRK